MNNEEKKQISIEKINEAVKQLTEQGKKVTELGVHKISGVHRKTIKKYFEETVHTENETVHTENETVHTENEIVHTENEIVHTENEIVHTGSKTVHTNVYIPKENCTYENVHTQEEIVHTKSVSSMEHLKTAQPKSATSTPTQEEINLVRQFYLINGEEVSKKEIVKLTNLPSSIVHQCMIIIEEEPVEILQETQQILIEKEELIQQPIEQKIINDHEMFTVNSFNPNKQDIYDYYDDLLFKYTGERRKKQVAIDEPKEEFKYINPYLKAV